MNIQDFSIQGINQYYDPTPLPQAPVFTYSEENFDLDFGLLTEYMIEDEKNYLKSDYNSNIVANVSGASSDEEGYSSGEDGSDRKKKYSSGDAKSRSKDQMDRRRERNRVLAKKTRLRKKFFFESLQRQVAQLSTENEMLKNIVKQRMTNEVKLEILSQCRTEIPSIVASSAQQATSLLEKADYRLMTAIHAAQRSFVITDPSLPDNPIIFAAKGFLELSGYRLDEVVGRNCRFMQGPKTDQAQVEVLRNGIHKGVDTAVCLLNYKRNGTPFYNQIFVAALRDSNNKIINYVGVQVEIKNYEEIEQNNKLTMHESEIIRKTAKSYPRKNDENNQPHPIPHQIPNRPKNLTKNTSNTQLNNLLQNQNENSIKGNTNAKLFDMSRIGNNSNNSLCDSNFGNSGCYNSNIGLDDLFNVFDTHESYSNNNSSNNINNNNNSNNNNNFY